MLFHAALQNAFYIYVVRQQRSTTAFEKMDAVE